MKALRVVGGFNAIIGSALFAVSTACADVPCDFKGVSVGDKSGPAEIMEKLGIKTYVTDPLGASLEEMQPLYQKYSIAVASELEDWKIGPYCRATYCRIPYGVTVGNSNLPVKVFVSFHSGSITEIDVNFSHISWDEVISIIKKKYGSDWRIDKSIEIITDYETKKDEAVSRIFEESATGGVNRPTGDTCKIWANSVDIVFKHHDLLGPFQSVFVIKLDLKNLWRAHRPKAQICRFAESEFAAFQEASASHNRSTESRAPIGKSWACDMRGLCSLRDWSGAVPHVAPAGSRSHFGLRDT